MRRVMMTAAAMTAAMTAAGAAGAQELERVEAVGSVTEATDRLVAAVEGAGASVIARVDHAAGAERAGMELAPMVKVIFGNPALGTPVMQADPLAGHVLPLQMLIFEEDGATVVAYEPPSAALEGYDVGAAAEQIERMEGALRNLAQAAAGG